MRTKLDMLIAGLTVKFPNIKIKEFPTDVPEHIDQELFEVLNDHVIDQILIQGVGPV